MIGGAEIIHGLGREWAWPKEDRDCRRVIFDRVADLKPALALCRDFGVAVQAGGNMGVWPWVLAREFGTVYAFEPDPLCFACLARNVTDSNVVKLQAALGCVRGVVGMANDHPGNLGAQYVVPQAPPYVPVLEIDDLGLARCDFIALDIEGAELQALAGAENTIRRYGPVLMIEDKGLSERFGSHQGDAERWLAAEFGYTVHRRISRDVILTPA